MWFLLGLFITAPGSGDLFCGPQSPSAFCNGPTCAELQGKLVVEGLEYMRQRGLTRIEATTVAEEAWRNHSIELSQAGLFTQADRARKRATRDLR